MPVFLDALLDTPQQLMLWGALFLGLGLGWLIQGSGFCLLRGLVQVRLGNPRKLKAFTLAMATALISTQTLVWWFNLDLNATFYLQKSPALPVIFIGGLIFGTGMVLSNACGARSVVLAATGNLRSLITLFCIALGAGLTLSGLFAEARVALENLTRFNLPSRSLPLPLGILLALGLIFYAVHGTSLRQEFKELSSAILIGLLITAGWWLTGVVGADEFEPTPLASVTFIAPIFEAQQYLLLFTGSRLSFGTVLVFSVFSGALIRALIKHEFNWQTFTSPQQLKQHLSGGLLMGVGGVLALGCTFGQALTGFSTLAWASLVALFGILLGAWFTLKHLNKT